MEDRYQLTHTWKSFLIGYDRDAIIRNATGTGNMESMGVAGKGRKRTSRVANSSILVVRRGSNTYGDEMIVPSGPSGPQQPVSVPEQPPSVVVQPPPAEEPKVVESGYRS
ncbi:hypothetical protein Aduo_013754 [Ancylostoma duodenale]